MMANASDPPPSDGEKERVWDSALAGALEGAAQEGSREVLAHGLISFVGEVAAQATAGAAVGFIAPLVRRLFDQSDAAAKRLKIILDEPFRTAVRTLRDVASIEFRSPAEMQECGRQLAQAFDNFATARSYAERDDPSRLEFIDVCQSLTAALMPGGRPFAELYLAPLEREVARLRTNAAQLMAKADETERNPGPELDRWVENNLQIEQNFHLTLQSPEASVAYVSRISPEAQVERSIADWRAAAQKMEAGCRPLEQYIAAIRGILG